MCTLLLYTTTASRHKHVSSQQFDHYFKSVLSSTERNNSNNSVLSGFLGSDTEWSVCFLTKLFLL